MAHPQSRGQKTQPIASSPPSKKHEALMSQLKKQEDNVTLRSKIAKILYKEQNFKKVVELLDPYSSDVQIEDLSILAHAYKHLNDYKNEARVLNLIIASRPENISVLLRLGRSYVEQDKFSEAVEQFRTAIKLNPKNEEAYNGILEIFKKQNNQYESQVIVKDMITRFGSKASYLSELCRIYTKEAYLEEAIKTCNQAILKDPKNPDNHANLAQSFKDKGDLKMSEKILKTSAQSFKSSERIYTMAGQFYFEQKNMGVANRYFSQAVLIERSSLSAQLGMARTSFLLGKYEQSLIGFENSCKIDNKETLRFLKESVTKLRLDGNHDWERKFNSLLFRCMQ